jgi:hypothetical protein
MKVVEHLADRRTEENELACTLPTPSTETPIYEREDTCMRTYA